MVRRPSLVRFSPPRPLGQLKPNFIWSLGRKGKQKIMAKIAVMSKYVKNFLKNLLQNRKPYNPVSLLLSFSERGKFLALDLGGTNFRVLMVQINYRDVDIQSKTYLIPQRIMLGTGTQVERHLLFNSQFAQPIFFSILHIVQPRREQSK